MRIILLSSLLAFTSKGFDERDIDLLKRR